MEVVVEEWGEGRSANHVGSGRRQPKTQFSRWRRSGIGPLLAFLLLLLLPPIFAQRRRRRRRMQPSSSFVFLGGNAYTMFVRSGIARRRRREGIALGGKAVRFASKKPVRKRNFRNETTTSR